MGTPRTVDGTETVCKLTTQAGTSHGDTRWVIGVWHTTTGEGDLCGPGWLHTYASPLLAVLLNPIDANVITPRGWTAEGAGRALDDHGLKCGYTRLRVLVEIPLPLVTLEQRVRFGIACALGVYPAPAFGRWAQAWLNGTNRTRQAALAAVAAVDAARAAARAARVAAARAAAWAARAATAEAVEAARAARVAAWAAWAAWAARVAAWAARAAEAARGAAEAAAWAATWAAEADVNLQHLAEWALGPAVTVAGEGGQR